MAYDAGESAGKVYSPSEFEVAVATWPLALFVSVILAPGITAPPGSFITPRNEVVAIWANTIAAKASSNTSAPPAEMRLI